LKQRRRRDQAAGDLSAAGKLLAEQIATGHIPDEIRAFDPLR
jgi:hypothetical protein